jgi:hypothetical protein
MSCECVIDHCPDGVADAEPVSSIMALKYRNGSARTEDAYARPNGTGARLFMAPCSARSCRKASLPAATDAILPSLLRQASPNRVHARAEAEKTVIRQSLIIDPGSEEPPNGTNERRLPFVVRMAAWTRRTADGEIHVCVRL